MGYVLKTDLAHRSNYGSWRDISYLNWIVIHYTANDGDTDENNGNYFNGANRNASAHFFVDDDSVTQSVPLEYSAWHCGGGLQGSGGHTYHKICTNSNSIGIEICDDVKNGVIYPSAKTIENVIALTKDLMKRFNIPASHVIRHYDVTGKICPAYWCGNAEKNNKWKTEFHNKLTGSATPGASVTPQPTTPTDNKLVVDGYWGKKTTTRLQQIFGTTVDGIISNQWAMYKLKNKGLEASTFDWQSKPNGDGSQLIRAMQKWAGMTGEDVDGEIGTQTIKAFQKKLGTTVDGYVSAPSEMVKALQRWANSQK